MPGRRRAAVGLARQGEQRQDPERAERPGEERDPHDVALAHDAAEEHLDQRHDEEIPFPPGRLLLEHVEELYVDEEMAQGEEQQALVVPPFEQARRDRREGQDVRGVRRQAEMRVPIHGEVRHAGRNGDCDRIDHRQPVRVGRVDAEDQRREEEHQVRADPVGRPEIHRRTSAPFAENGASIMPSTGSILAGDPRGDTLTEITGSRSGLGRSAGDKSRRLARLDEVGQIAPRHVQERDSREEPARRGPRAGETSARSPRGG